MSWFLSLVYLILYSYGKEKFFLDHSWELKAQVINMYYFNIFSSLILVVLFLLLFWIVSVVANHYVSHISETTWKKRNAKHPRCNHLKCAETLTSPNICVTHSLGRNMERGQNFGGWGLMFVSLNLGHGMFFLIGSDLLSCINT